MLREKGNVERAPVTPPCPRGLAWLEFDGLFRVLKRTALPLHVLTTFLLDSTQENRGLKGGEWNGFARHNL